MTQPHGIQQVRAAEYTSLIGTPDRIRTVINRYIDIGLTHFVLDLVGLDKDTIKIIDSKIIKKL
jgi:alkanesulfonate monooxygenase SsuD/methylene tetrahydromethanopterin reductase-like flavin-dependent oxidoreductase (luciferase family)